MAVEQHDVAGRTEAAKVDERRTAVAVVDRRTDRRDDARQFAQDFFGDVRLLELDGVRRGHVDRGRLLEVRVTDESTGNDDIFAFCGGLLLDGFLVVVPGA